VADPFSDCIREKEVRVRYRELSRTAHPDAGGDAAEFAELTAQRDAALARIARAPCPACNGSGQEVIARRGPKVVTRLCPECRGAGRPV
jgi:DnaJ-class molecular chaperone